MCEVIRLDFLAQNTPKIEACLFLKKQKSHVRYLYITSCHPWKIHHNLFITLLLGSKPISVSYPNRVILRVKCIGYIEKGVLNSLLGSNPSTSYIQSHVIMNCVIKRFRCTGDSLYLKVQGTRQNTSSYQ